MANFFGEITHRVGDLVSYPVKMGKDLVTKPKKGWNELTHLYTHNEHKDQDLFQKGLGIHGWVGKHPQETAAAVVATIFSGGTAAGAFGGAGAAGSAGGAGALGGSAAGGLGAAGSGAAGYGTAATSAGSLFNAGAAGSLGSSAGGSLAASGAGGSAAFGTGATSAGSLFNAGAGYSGVAGSGSGLLGGATGSATGSGGFMSNLMNNPQMQQMAMNQLSGSGNTAAPSQNGGQASLGGAGYQSYMTPTFTPISNSDTAVTSTPSATGALAGSTQQAPAPISQAAPPTPGASAGGESFLDKMNKSTTDAWGKFTAPSTEKDTSKDFNNKLQAGGTLALLAANMFNR